MVEFDSQLQPLLDLIRDAQTAVSEVARQINTYGEELEADPDRLEEVASANSSKFAASTDLL